MEGASDHIDVIGSAIGTVIVLAILIFYYLRDRGAYIDYIDKIKKILKWFVATFIGFSIKLYTAFVAMCLWNWFAVRALNINSISFLEMIGIVLLVSLFTDGINKDHGNWKILFSVLEWCVPDQNREMVAEVMQEQKEQMWTDALIMSLGNIGGITITLILGYGLHLLIG